MYRKKKKTRNKKEKSSPTAIEFMQYDMNETSRKSIEKDVSVKTLFNDNKVNWVNVVGLQDTAYITKICSDFGLYNFDIKELLMKPDVIKIALYEDITFALLTLFNKDSEDVIKAQQVAIILGRNFVVSFVERNKSFNALLNTYIENNIVTLKKKSSDFLFYILMSAICQQNNQFVLKEEESLVAIEEELIENNKSEDILHFLHTQRLAQMKMKHYNNSLREEFENIFDNDNHLIQEDTMNYFNNLEDRLRTLSSNIEYYRESIFSLQDLYYNTINTNTNIVMKRLTIISIIFIPLTFLAGIWGMNFDVMPELRFKYGYLGAWISFILVAVAIVIYLKKKKWF